MIYVIKMETTEYSDMWAITYGDSTHSICTSRTMATAFDDSVVSFESVLEEYVPNVYHCTKIKLYDINELVNL